MCCDCTGLEPICAAADQRVGLDLSRIDRRVSRFDRSIRDTSPPRIPNRPPSCSVWLLRVARGDTQRQIRPGPTSAPTISALFAASNVFDRTLMPNVVGLGRGRTSTCSMTSFATHGTVTELDLQRRIRLFPAEDTKTKERKRKVNSEDATCKRSCQLHLLRREEDIVYCTTPNCCTVCR